MRRLCFLYPQIVILLFGASHLSLDHVSTAEGDTTETYILLRGPIVRSISALESIDVIDVELSSESAEATKRKMRVVC